MRSPYVRATRSSSGRAAIAHSCCACAISTGLESISRIVVGGVLITLVYSAAGRSILSTARPLRQQAALPEDLEPLAEHVLGVDALGEAGLAELHRAEQRGQRPPVEAPKSMSAYCHDPPTKARHLSRRAQAGGDRRAPPTRRHAAGIVSASRCGSGSPTSMPTTRRWPATRRASRTRRRWSR